MTAPRLACLADHSTYLAHAARRLLREREERYPAAIDSGAITAADAARKLHLARCIADQWHWIDDRSDPAEPEFDFAIGGSFGAMNHEMAAELDEAAARARALAKAAPDDWEKRELADLYEALAWHQRPSHGRTGEARVVAAVAAWRAIGAGQRMARERVK